MGKGVKGVQMSGIGTKLLNCPRMEGITCSYHDSVGVLKKPETYLWGVRKSIEFRNIHNHHVRELILLCWCSSIAFL